MKDQRRKIEAPVSMEPQNDDLEKDLPFPIISREEYAKISKNLRTLSDVTAFTKALVAPTIQAMLEAEMENHLGYKKHESSGDNTGNSRNGYYSKTITTSEAGKATLQIPRDRKGEFEPLVIRKYETIENGVEEKIVSMYAKGMTTRDIQAHMRDIYAVDISADMVSNITDKVLPLIKEWENRPLEKIYPIVFLDAIHYKVRDSGKIVSKAAYNILGLNLEGKKELLGVWIGENEGAKYWLGVLNELKNRGVEDILILAMDGLIGLPEAAKTVFPKTEIQLCIIHQIRNTLKYVSHKEKKNFMEDLKLVYKASTEKAALENLEKMKEKWPQYKFALKSWETKWSELSTFYKFPEEVRKVIYTTNAIEGLHRQFRKVTKTTSIFPHNESLLKLLWLAQKDITKKWTMSIDNWGLIMGQLSLMYTDRIEV